MKEAIQMMLAGAVAVGFGLAAFGEAAAGTTWHVPGDYGTLQDAMNMASSGDTILVGPGTYTSGVNFGGKAVSLRSTSGPEVTIIRPASGRGAAISGAGAELIGFTIADAHIRGGIGSGVVTSGTGSLIEGCIFDGNIQATGYWGAAIGGNVSSPIIRGNIFRNNTSDTQYGAGVVSFANASSPVIENNVFEDNPTRALFLHLPKSAYPKVFNNTFVRNSSAINGGYGEYRNNIAVDNGVGVAGGFATFENNLIFGNDTNYANDDMTGLAGNISADPMFVDPLGDYMLAKGSPAIDAGSPTGAPLVDILGAPRPLNGDGIGQADFDIGAYEFTPPLAFDDQAAGDSNWSSPGNWNDLPGPGTLVPGSSLQAIIGSAHTVYVVAAGQAAESLDIIDTATLNVTTGDLTVGGAVSVGPMARLNVSNRLTAETVAASGAVTLGDNSTVSGAVTVISGSFTAGAGVTVGSLESESTALHVGAGGITITDKLSLHGTSEWTHAGSGNFTVGNSATGNLMDGVTELVLNGGALAIVVETDAAPPDDATVHYTFDNTYGVTVHNDGSAGPAGDAVLVNGASLTTGSGGKIGEGMTIADETAQRLTANTGIDLADTAVVDGAWTIATWFHNVYPDDDWRVLTRGGGNFQVMVHRDNNDLETYVGGSFHDSNYDLLPGGGWHHLVAVGSGSQTQFYIDGAAVGDVIPARSGTEVKWIGNYSGAAFAEIIDEFYVFDRALTEAEIQQLSDRVPLDLSDTNVAVTVNSTLAPGARGTVILKGISLDPGVRLGISSESDDIRLTNLTLGDGASLAADDRDTEITVGGVLSSVGSTGHLGGEAEAYIVSLTLETGAAYEWEFGKTGGVVSSDLVVVNGDLTLGDGWKLEFLPAADTEWFDGTEQADLFSFTGTLTGDLAKVLFDAPADWITDNVTLHEDLDRGGAGVNYIYMTGLETVPEPTSAALLLVGFGAAVWRRRRR